MSAPLIGLGHGLALEALEPFLIDPQLTDGVQYAQRDYSLDLTLHEQGAFCVAIWPVIDGVDDLDELLAQMGLDEDSDLRAAVTVYLPTKRRKWHRYNGYANMPQTLSYAFWPSNLRVIFNDLLQIG